MPQRDDHLAGEPQGLVADDGGDDQGDGGIQPGQARVGQDDRPGDRHPGGGGAVGQGVEQHGPHVGPVTRGVARCTVVAPQDQAGAQHHQASGPAGDQDRQAVHVARPGDQPAGRAGGHHGHHRQQRRHVNQRGVGGGAGEAAGPAPGRCPAREPDGQQADPDGGGISEVVAARGQHCDRMRAGPGHHQARDQGEVQQQHDREPGGAGHKPSVCRAGAGPAPGAAPLGRA
jgi:hypothetical protein